MELEALEVGGPDHDDDGRYVEAVGCRAWDTILFVCLPSLQGN